MLDNRKALQELAGVVAPSLQALFEEQRKDVEERFAQAQAEEKRLVGLMQQIQGSLEQVRQVMLRQQGEWAQLESLKRKCAGALAGSGNGSEEKKPALTVVKAEEGGEAHESQGPDRDRGEGSGDLGDSQKAGS